MLKNCFDLCGTWTMFYAENRNVKKIKESITTTADAKRLIYSSVEGTVPGNFELDLHRAGLIGDPYFGTNTLEMQKLENLHLWYCRTFTYHGTADENTMLRFEGIITQRFCFVQIFQAARFHIRAWIAPRKAPDSRSD